MARTVKGLQVQMVDDALELGIGHAALNCDLGQLLALEPGPGDVRVEDGEGELWLRAAPLERLDAQVRLSLIHI